MVLTAERQRPELRLSRRIRGVYSLVILSLLMSACGVDNNPSPPPPGFTVDFQPTPAEVAPTKTDAETKPTNEESVRQIETVAPPDLSVCGSNQPFVAGQRLSRDQWGEIETVYGANIGGTIEGLQTIGSKQGLELEVAIVSNGRDGDDFRWAAFAFSQGELIWPQLNGDYLNRPDRQLQGGNPSLLLSPLPIPEGGGRIEVGFSGESPAAALMRGETVQFCFDPAVDRLVRVEHVSGAETPEPAESTGTVSPAQAAETKMFGAGGAFPEFVKATFPGAAGEDNDEILMTATPPPETSPIWTEDWGVKFPPEYTATGSYINQSGEKMLDVKFQMSKSVLDGTGIESIYVDRKMLTEAVVLFWGQFAASLQVREEGDPDHYAAVYPEFAETTFYNVSEPSPEWIADLVEKIHRRLENGRGFQFDGRFGRRIINNEPRQPICDLNAVRLTQVSSAELEVVRSDAARRVDSGVIFRDIDQVAVNTPDTKGVVLFDCKNGVLSIVMASENVIELVAQRGNVSLGPESLHVSIADLTPPEALKFGAAKVVYMLRGILEVASKGVNLIDRTPFFNLFGCGWHSENCGGTEIRDPQNPDRVLVRVEVNQP